jgi:hypothetical protein
MQNDYRQNVIMPFLTEILSRKTYTMGSPRTTTPSTTTTTTESTTTQYIPAGWFKPLELATIKPKK